MSATRRPFHEIPNPQVLYSARQFRNGYLLLIRHSPAGVLLPALHCASIALELYLKSLSAHPRWPPKTGQSWPPENRPVRG